MMIREEQVRLGVRADDWREAIREAGELLVQCGGADQSYIEAMIRTTEQLGPYIVIAPGIAIPHARPEDGALNTCFVVLLLDPPIDFGNPDNDPVSLIVAFSSPSKKDHIDALTNLARQIGQEDFLYKASQAKNKTELVELFNRPLDDS
ncbi:MAG: PTS transporter subunit EIIA [Anaerolineales bacterium]|nr:PTS transporter subunit EIIA [Anaerolineales bacterium]